MDYANAPTILSNPDLNKNFSFISTKISNKTKRNTQQGDSKIYGRSLPCGQMKGAGYHETIETDDFKNGSKHKDV